MQMTQTLDARLALIFASETPATREPTDAEVVAAARKMASKGYAGVAYIVDVAAELKTTVAALAPTLLRLNQQQRINLRRADLVGAMDSRKVQTSEIQHPMLRTATFHFVALA